METGSERVSQQAGVAAVAMGEGEAAIPNYRQQVRRALPDHYFKPDAKSLLWLIPHAILIGLGLYVLAAHFSWWTAPLVSLLIGHSFTCLGFLGHEIAHGAVVRNARLRDIFAGIAFSPMGIGPLLWRRWHNAEHHNNTNIEGEDPDHLFTIDTYKDEPVLKALYKLSPLLRNLVIFGSFTFRMTQHQTTMMIRHVRRPETSRRDRAILLAQWAGPIVFWVGLTAMLGWQVLVFGYIIPLLIGNFIGISYIVTNHFLNPLADERDVLATSLSVTMPRGLGWLDPIHLYFGAHVAHHLFPGAPAKYTREIEAKIAELWPDRYHVMTITKALRLLWNTPWIYEDHVTFYDPQRDVRAPTLGHGLEKMK
jgi:fatty acid desaturase